MSEPTCNECGIRFRCPRCNAIAPGLGGESASTAHRFASRALPDDVPGHWITVDEAAELVGISRKSLAIFGAQVAKHVRRRRAGHSFLWYRPDLESIAHVRAACGLGFDGALRTYAALVEGRL